MNGTGGVLSIRVATVPSDRLKGSEGREGVKTLWSALAEFRCRWDSRLLGGQVSLVVYEGLTLILTFCLQSLRCGFAPWEPPSGAWVAGSLLVYSPCLGEKQTRCKRKSPPSLPTVAPQPHPCIAPCPPPATVTGSVSENGPDWEGEFKDLNRKEVIKEF